MWIEQHTSRELMMNALNNNLCWNIMKQKG